MAGPTRHALTMTHETYAEANDLREVSSTASEQPQRPLADGAGDPSEIASDLSKFQDLILTVLADEARYGLAIKRELQDYYHEEVNHGRLYPNLDKLIGRGLVEKSQLDRRTNQYAITTLGEAVLEADQEWREQYLEADEVAVTDGGTTIISDEDLEAIDVTLEQSLMRSGDDEVVRWTADADTVDQGVASDTPAEALRMLADELEVHGGSA